MKRDYFKGKPFITGGLFSTIKGRESRCAISCPHCNFKSYSFHVPGSCCALTCPSCFQEFMGSVEVVNCGECEQRIRCLGLQPVRFEFISSKDFPRISSDNYIIITDTLKALRDALNHATFGGVITGGNKTLGE